MRLFNKVAIIGVGLIGGSMALAIKKKKLSAEVIGVSRHKKTIALALKIGAIDKGSIDLSILKDADLIILAAPVSTILNLGRQLPKFIKPNCLVTDVGSTKGEIVRKLNKTFAHYVGSHPLAGSEKQGALYASPDIFRGSFCILTPLRNTEKASLQKIKQLWTRLGAKVIFMSPDTHDRILSLLSHLPHAVAFSLIESIPDKFLKLAPAGLKDTTRIASSDAQLWSDIFLTNQKNIIKAIRLLQRNLSRIEKAIQKKDKKLLEKILKEAKRKRDSLK